MTPITGDRIGVAHFSSPVNVGGRYVQSLGAGEMKFTACAGWGLALEPRAGGATVIVPWDSIARIELRESAAEMPVTRPVAPPTPAQTDPAPTETPAPAGTPISVHELQARAAKEELERKAAERRGTQDAEATATAAPTVRAAPAGDIVVDEFGGYSRRSPTPPPAAEHPAANEGAATYKPGGKRRVTEKVGDA